MARARTRSSARASSSTPASSRRRSTASARRTAASSRATTWPRGRRRWKLPPPTTTQATRCARRARGARGRSSSSSWRCSRGSTSTDMSPAELVHTVTECAKLAFADRDALYGDADVPLDRLLSTDYNDERRKLVGERRVVRAPARPRQDAAARRGGGDARLRRADARARHRPRRRRRPLRQPRLGDAERRLVRQLADHSGARLAARDARADVLAGGGAALVARSPQAAANDAVTRPRSPGRESRTSPSARPAATSRISGRCTSSCAMSTSA